MAERLALVICERTESYSLLMFCWKPASMLVADVPPGAWKFAPATAESAVERPAFTRDVMEP